MDQSYRNQNGINQNGGQYGGQYGAGQMPQQNGGYGAAPAAHPAVKRAQLFSIISLAMAALCLLYAFIVWIVRLADDNAHSWWVWMALIAIIGWAVWATGAVMMLMKIRGLRMGQNHEATAKGLQMPFFMVAGGIAVGWVFFVVYFIGFCAYLLRYWHGARAVVECIFSIVIPIALPPIALWISSQSKGLVRKAAMEVPAVGAPAMGAQVGVGAEVRVDAGVRPSAGQAEPQQAEQADPQAEPDWDANSIIYPSGKYYRPETVETV